MQEYIKIFNGYRHAYGIADWTNAIVDPESGKKKPNYRWTYEEFTDTIYQEHLEGKISVGIQPTNENGDARFGVIDIDPKQYENFNKQLYLETIQEYINNFKENPFLLSNLAKLCNQHLNINNILADLEKELYSC